MYVLHLRLHIGSSSTRCSNPSIDHGGPDLGVLTLSCTPSSQRLRRSRTEPFVEPLRANSHEPHTGGEKKRGLFSSVRELARGSIRGRPSLVNTTQRTNSNEAASAEVSLVLSRHIKGHMTHAMH
jgi:hypothetical protein